MGKRKKHPHHRLLMCLRSIMDPIGNVAAMVIEHQQKEIDKLKKELECYNTEGVSDG